MSVVFARSLGLAIALFLLYASLSFVFALVSTLVLCVLLATLPKKCLLYYAWLPQA